MCQTLRRLVLAVATSAGALGIASAAPVFIQFGGGPEVVAENLETQGFVFSPSCHYDLLGFLGFDRAGCNDPGSVNPNYLGGNATSPDRAFLFVARSGGGPFSLASLTLGGLTAGQAAPAFDMLSSAGGYEYFDGTDAVDQTFTGSQWTGVEWLLFSNFGGTAVGIDNLLLDVSDAPAVPEPASFGLAALALLAAAAARRGR